jgi:hypothetical protein
MKRISEPVVWSRSRTEPHHFARCNAEGEALKALHGSDPYVQYISGRFSQSLLHLLLLLPVTLRIMLVMKNQKKNNFDPHATFC